MIHQIVPVSFLGMFSPPSTSSGPPQDSGKALLAACSSRSVDTVAGPGCASTAHASSSRTFDGFVTLRPAKIERFRTASDPALPRNSVQQQPVVQSCLGAAHSSSPPVSGRRGRNPQTRI